MDFSRVRRSVVGGMLVLWAAGAASGCAPDSADDGDVTTVTVALTTVPTGVQCVRLVAAPTSGSATTKTFTVAAGSSSASLPIGPFTPGNYTLSGDAFNVACTGISGVAPWTADSVPVTVRTGQAATVTMTFRKENPVTVNVNFVNNVLGLSMSFMNGFVVTDSGILQTGVIPGAGLVHAGQLRGLRLELVRQRRRVRHAASNSVCAIRVDGTIWCWGSNPYGETGPGIALGGSSSTPVQLTALGGAAQIAAGANHFCAVRRTSFGAGAATNRAGSATTPPPAAPIRWSRTSCPCGLFLGFSSSYAVSTSGTLFAWGSNASGQLGDGTFVNRLIATSMLESVGVISVAGGGNHACDQRADRASALQGQNFSGQLGNGTTSASSATPVVVSGLTAMLVASYSSNCAPDHFGPDAVLGLEPLQAVGDSTAVDRTTPVSGQPMAPSPAHAGRFEHHRHQLRPLVHHGRGAGAKTMRATLATAR